MSADNWSDCPRCHAARVKAHEDAGKDLEAQYGKVDGASWAQAKAAYDSKGPPVFESADGSGFREDYEFWLDVGGVLHISYSGWCQKCAFGIDFEHEIQIEGMP